MTKIKLLLAAFIFSTIVVAQEKTDTVKVVKPEEPKKQWFEKTTIRGYAQARYNRLLETNPDLGCEQCDKSWGEDGGFFMRRIRVIFYGQISKQVYFYVQPDFASSAGTTGHVAQLRDAYFDLGVDKDNVFRFRVGQSKVPFGFENMQSSQNRLPLDRNDAINSAVSNERDLGVFFYFTPKSRQELFKEISDNGLKHTGNYGVFGIGIYNGQTANKPDLNDQQHIVARLTYPIRIGSQIIEPGVQGYSGNFTIPSSQVNSKVKHINDYTYLDQRAAATFVLYPKPFGIQAEYNVGKGPEFNKNTDSIEVKNLEGGYVTLSYMTKIKNHIIIPFVRGQYYIGGKKHETDARSYKVNEVEIGIEWQPVKQFEFVVMYTISKRRYEDYAKQDNFQEGSLLRLQAQVNF
jgi:hypothetical protein